MRSPTRLMLAVAVLAGAACRDDTPLTSPTAEPSLRPVAAAEESFIVVFRRGTGDVIGLAAKLAAAHGGTISFVYQHAIQGFAARFPVQAVAGLQRNPQVAFVEPDHEFTVSGTQTGATWGLDRIDQRDLPLDDTYSYAGDGSGVRVYIIDTGIRRTHEEFGRRVAPGFSSIRDRRGTTDCNGHGTHVAGTVGGALHGVAKQVSLVPVRVINCAGKGTASTVIAGIDWVTANQIKPAVANMSVGGATSLAIDQAVESSIAAGITYVLAAGNKNGSACNISPARVPAGITVGNTTKLDARASNSNYGTCLDLFAPGTDITSAGHTTDSATVTLSGTSMAAPHVAGVAALMLQGNPVATPSAIAQGLTANASVGRITSAGPGSPNLLLYSGFVGGKAGLP